MRVRCAVGRFFYLYHLPGQFVWNLSTNGEAPFPPFSRQQEQRRRAAIENYCAVAVGTGEKTNEWGGRGVAGDGRAGVFPWPPSRRLASRAELSMNKRERKNF